MWEIIYTFLKAHIELTLFGALTLIQIAPIKINPWSRIAHAVHDLFFGETDRKIDAVIGKVDRLENQAEEDKAIQARTHILRFADELYDGRHHSQEYFLQMLDDIKTYERYCGEHPDFPNGRTVQACDLIKTTYEKLWEQHKF